MISLDQAVEQLKELKAIKFHGIVAIQFDGHGDVVLAIVPEAPHSDADATDESRAE